MEPPGPGPEAAPPSSFKVGRRCISFFPPLSGKYCLPELFLSLSCSWNTFLITMYYFLLSHTCILRAGCFIRPAIDIYIHTSISMAMGSCAVRTSTCTIKDPGVYVRKYQEPRPTGSKNLLVLVSEKGRLENNYEGGSLRCQLQFLHLACMIFLDMEPRRPRRQ